MGGIHGEAAAEAALMQLRLEKRPEPSQADAWW